MDLNCLKDVTAKITPHALLRDFTTFGLGGRCPALVECTDATALADTVMRLRRSGIPFILMGAGSNILASDHGIGKVVVRYCSTDAILRCGTNSIIVDAATPLDTLAATATDQGFEGLTSLLGIPGTVGGAIAGNAGAYGRQIAEHLSFMTILRPDNTIRTLPASAVKFSYRDSEIKHNGDIILVAEFELVKTIDPTTLAAERATVIGERKFKLDFWKTVPCAGSFFRNVEPSSKAGPRQAAGWFLEQAGARTLEHEGARVYCGHANIITRDEGAKAQAVHDLSVKMAALVKEKFGLDLVREVRMLGKFDHAANCDPDGYW